MGARAHVHLSIDINLLVLLLIIGMDLNPRLVNSVKLSDVEVLLGFRPDFVRLVFCLLADERHHLLDLLLNLRVIHFGTRVGGQTSSCSWSK